LLEDLLRSTDSGRRQSANGLEDAAESKAPAIELRLDF
jgi:hypothetical protein